MVDSPQTASFISVDIGRSPADSLTYNLVSNLLTIAGTRPSARQQVLDSIWAYLNKLSSFVFSENGIVIVLDRLWISEGETCAHNELNTKSLSFSCLPLVVQQ